MLSRGLMVTLTSPGGYCLYFKCKHCNMIFLNLDFLVTSKKNMWRKGQDWEIMNLWKDKRKVSDREMFSKMFK